jgi:decaprenyl-phosphate phosphoribosyltransferase
MAEKHPRLCCSAAAGLLGRPSIMGRFAACAAAFTAASAGTYLLNDVIDTPRDRLHPDKQSRPVASGELSVTAAVSVGTALLIAAVAGAWFVGRGPLVTTVASYVAITVDYSVFLKHIPVVELACVSSRFVLRAVAGGAAAHIAASPWFVIVTSAGSLLVVTGKRSAELALLGGTGREHRLVLAAYSPRLLRSIRLVASGVAVIGYALWTFARTAHLDLGHGDLDDLVLQLSILPFVIGTLSIELAIEAGRGGSPEDLALNDHRMQALALASVALVLIGIYT